MNLSGRDLDDVQRCRVCGCHEFAPCLHNGAIPCVWLEEDLCSACADPVMMVYQHQVCPECEGIGIGEFESGEIVVELHCVRCKGIGGLNRVSTLEDEE